MACLVCLSCHVHFYSLLLIGIPGCSVSLLSNLPSFLVHLHSLLLPLLVVHLVLFQESMLLPMYHLSFGLLLMSLHHLCPHLHPFIIKVARSEWTSSNLPQVNSFGPSTATSLSLHPGWHFGTFDQNAYYLPCLIYNCHIVSSSISAGTPGYAFDSLQHPLPDMDLLVTLLAASHRSIRVWRPNKCHTFFIVTTRPLDLQAFCVVP